MLLAGCGTGWPPGRGYRAVRAGPGFGRRLMTRVEAPWRRRPGRSRSPLSSQLLRRPGRRRAVVGVDRHLAVSPVPQSGSPEVPGHVRSGHGLLRPPVRHGDADRTPPRRAGGTIGSLSLDPDSTSAGRAGVGRPAGRLRRRRPGHSAARPGRRSGCPSRRRSTSATSARGACPNCSSPTGTTSRPTGASVPTSWSGESRTARARSPPPTAPGPTRGSPSPATCW